MHCQSHMQEAHLQKCLTTANTSDSVDVAHAGKCSGCRSCKRLPAKPAMDADHEHNLAWSSLDLPQQACIWSSHVCISKLDRHGMLARRWHSTCIKNAKSARDRIWDSMEAPE